jgi:hypothetical protein
MLLPLVVILEQLEGYQPMVRLAPGKSEEQSFDCVYLLPDVFEPLPKVNTLFVSSADQLLARQGEIPEGITVICPQTEQMTEEAVEKIPCSVILLKQAGNLADFFNRLSVFFYGMNAWEREISRVLIQKENIQEFLNVSEPYFTNPIVIMNKSMMPVAYTRNLPFRHPDLIELGKTGRFPERMVIGIGRTVVEAEKYKTIGFMYRPNYLNCTIVIRAYQANPMQLNLACMYGVNSEPTQTDLHKMRFLTDAIEEYLSTMSDQGVSEHERNVCYLLDLLNGKISKRDLTSLSSLLTLPLHGNYRLYLIRCTSESIARSNYISELLRGRLPYVTVFPYQRRILLLANESTDTERQAVSGIITPVLNTYDSFCGISRKFEELSDFRDAYTQAEAAAQLGRTMHPNERTYDYSDYYIEHLIFCGIGEISWDNIFDHVLGRIAEHDKARKTDNLKLLEVYLNCDRNITMTAQIMHLHRNSVLYRLQRLEEEQNLDLSNPQTELNLQVSLRAFHLKEALQL